MLRTLRESGFQGGTADPIVKWQKKQLVGALIQIDEGYNEDSADGLNAVFTHMAENEGNVEAVEDLKASECVRAAAGLNKTARFMVVAKIRKIDLVSMKEVKKDYII